MKITIQNNPYECGLCVANMIINHYNKTNHDLRDEFLSQINLTSTGINIYDLEILLNQYHIQSSTYQASIEELYKLKTPFILLLNDSYQGHFVVGIINSKKELEIYDPMNKKSIYKIGQPIQNWTGIVVTTSWKRQSFKPINLEYKILKNTSYIMNFIFILLNISEVVVTMLLSWFMSKLLNISLNHAFSDVFWKISFIYVGILVVSIGFMILNKLVKHYYQIQVSEPSIKLFWQQMLYKNFNFYEVNTSHQMLQYFEFAIKLINFYTLYVSEIISDAIILIASVIILILINPSNLIIIFLFILLNILIMFPAVSYNKKTVNHIVDNQVVIENELYSWLEKKKSNYDLHEDGLKISQIQSSILKMMNETFHNSYKEFLIDMFNKFINDLFMYILIIILMRNSSSINLGSIFINITIFNIASKNIVSVLDFVKEYYSSLIIYKLLQSALMTNNIKLQKSGIIVTEQINSISCDGIEFHDSLNINYNNLIDYPLVNQLITAYDPLDKIKINEINLKSIKPNDWAQHVIYLDFHHISKLDLLNNFKNQTEGVDYQRYIGNLLKKYHLDSRYLQQQCYIYHHLKKLSLLKNKLIIIDYDFYNLYEPNQKTIYELMLKIKSQNFIINNCKSNSFINLYENFI